MKCAKQNTARARRGTARCAGHTRLESRELRSELLLAWSGFLTTAQLKLAGGYPTLRRAQRRLRVPLDYGHTKVVLQGGALHRSSIHSLTDLGREHLIERGLLDPNYRTPRIPREQKRAHALLVRDVFTAFAAADGAGAWRLQDFRFEGELARIEPFRQMGLVPDALATVVLNSREPKTICVEADCATETTTTLRKKFARWRAVFDGWQPPFPILLVVAPRDGRRRTIETILNQSGLADRGVVLLTAELESFIDGVGTPHDSAARPRRFERSTISLQPPRLTVLSNESQAAFRALRSD